MRTIRPKTGDTFIFEPGAIMRGSKALSGWQQGDGHWYVDGQSHRAALSRGKFHTRDARAEHPNDLITGDASTIRHRRHMESLEATRGTDGWFFDYDAERICIGFDPASAGQIRTCVMQWAFLGDEGVDDVTISSLDEENPGRICEYATPNGQGVVNGWRAMWGWARDNEGNERIAGKRWRLFAMEIHHNHAKSFNLAEGWVAKDCRLHHNLEMGYGASRTGDTKSKDIEVSGCEVAHNNYLRTWSASWHACGAKLVGTSGAKVHHNWHHHNGSSGLWFDIANEAGDVHHNLCEDNAGPGIFWEHGQDAEIYQNLSRRNGADPDDGKDLWVTNAQILIIAATGGQGEVHVHDNVLEIHDPGHDNNTGPDGLIVRDDNRTVTRNIRVERNRIVFMAPKRRVLYPRCGVAVGRSTPKATVKGLFETVTWDENEYWYPGPADDDVFIVPVSTRSLARHIRVFSYLNFRRWQRHQGAGWDRHSSFNANVAEPGTKLVRYPSRLPDWDNIMALPQGRG